MSLIICPTGCETELPPVQFDPCNPETHNGRIDKIYVTNVGYPLVDWADLVEWQARLSNTSTDPDAIRTLYVNGDKAVPESNVKVISLGRRVVGNKAHTLNFDIDETNALNHEFLRKVECGGNYLFWYEDSNGLLYGGQIGTEGIEGFFQINMLIPRSVDDLLLYPGTVLWDAKFTEARIESPMA